MFILQIDTFLTPSFQKHITELEQHTEVLQVLQIYFKTQEGKSRRSHLITSWPQFMSEMVFKALLRKWNTLDDH